MESFQFSDKVNGIQAGIFAKLNQKKEELVSRGNKVYNCLLYTSPSPRD